MHKKTISFIIILNILFSVFGISHAEPQDTAAQPSETEQTEVSDTSAQTKETVENTIDMSLPAPHAGAVVLEDLKSGKVLYERNSTEKMFPASTTKIMTAILVLENANLEDNVTATKEAIEPITNKHSHMGIKIGEVLTVEQLLYGMLVYSANDAANVLAVHVAGGLEAFAVMMNEKADELGAVNTHFVNPHGFHDPEHFTCAKDLALFAKYAMQNDKFREIVKTDMYTIDPTEKYTETRYLSNTNHLISRRRRADCFYGKAIGIKTGYTDEAASCLVAAAQDGDTELLSVVMKCNNISSPKGAFSFLESRDLLEYGFNNFKYITINSIGDIISDSPVYEAKNDVRVALTPAENISALLPVDINTADDIDIDFEFTNEKITAPIKKGDKLGSVIYKYNGEMIASSMLIAANDVQRDYIITVIHIAIKLFTNPIFNIVFVLFVLALIRARIVRKKKRKSRRSMLTHVDENHIYRTKNKHRRRR